MEPILTNAYSNLQNIMGCPNNRMVMAREVIADRGIWTAKKRYILNVHNNEGVQYAEPKLKIMGIEAIKSSTPEVCRDALKSIFKTIMTKGESEAQREIESFRQEFYKMTPEQIAFPRGVNNLRKWASSNTVYVKGTPINTRAALLYNTQLKQHGLTREYESIKEGEKIKFLMLKTPNPLRENVIGFPDKLPPEFGLHPYIDYKLQFEKTFVDALKLVFNAINWNIEETNTLESFFA